MPTTVLMPALSPTMTEGKLAKWLKKEGDKVKSGEVLAEIETDKATMEVEAVDEGTLGRILVKDGTEGVAVNTPIALLLNEGEKASDLDAAAAAAKKAAAAAAKKAAPASPPKAEAVPQPQAQPAPQPQPAPHPAPAAAPAPQRASGERVFASPLARRIARDQGIDLSAISGSGPHGRIVRADVEAAAARGGARAGAVGGGVTAGLGQSFPPAQAEVVPHSTMRKVIAKRLSESKQTVPHFYVDVDCEIDELLKLRAELNEMLPDAKISVNDFVVRAAALALMKVPEVNVSWGEDGMKRYKSADISIAVAIEGGLITPIVRAADKKGVAAISAEVKDLAARAKGNKLKPEEFQGGTFSISNMGMFGVRAFSAIINPPQAAILAVATGEKRPVVRNDQLAIATVMTLTLSADHRVVDGATGAQFMKVLKELIEHPLRLVI
ncbi:MAG: pyruvate dehydrogenase complex dihydrolipoamide acetyltransferase [Gemmatimonas sp.]